MCFWAKWVDLMSFWKSNYFQYLKDNRGHFFYKKAFGGKKSWKYGILQKETKGQPGEKGHSGEALPSDLETLHNSYPLTDPKKARGYWKFMLLYYTFR